MDTTKWALAAKRFWGMLFAVLGLVLPWANTTFGWNIDVSAMTGWNEAVVNLIDSVFVFGGLALAAWGSYVADKPLVMSKAKADVTKPSLGA